MTVERLEILQEIRTVYYQKLSYHNLIKWV